MNQPAILDLLENNARLTSQDLADILNEDKETVEAEIQNWKTKRSSADIIQSLIIIKHCVIKRSWLTSK